MAIDFPTGVADGYEYTYVDPQGTTTVYIWIDAEGVWYPQTAGEAGPPGGGGPPGPSTLFANTEVPKEGAGKFGRDSSQYWTFYGNESGNFFTSISQASNQKSKVTFGISVDSGNTLSSKYEPQGADGNIWHSGNHGVGSGLDADRLQGYDISFVATPSTIATRNSDGDVTGRTYRSTISNDSYCNGAIAFRTSNSTDNYVRFCSDTGQIRNFIDVYSKSEVPKKDGTGASGTWSIRAAEATKVSIAGEDANAERPMLYAEGRGVNSIFAAYQSNFSGPGGNGVMRYNSNANCIICYRGYFTKIDGVKSLSLDLNGQAAKVLQNFAPSAYTTDTYDTTSQVDLAKLVPLLAEKLSEALSRIEELEVIAQRVRDIG